MACGVTKESGRDLYEVTKGETFTVYFEVYDQTSNPPTLIDLNDGYVLTAQVARRAGDPVLADFVSEVSPEGGGTIALDTNVLEPGSYSFDARIVLNGYVVFQLRDSLLRVRRGVTS